MIGKRLFKRHSICQRVVSTVLSAILAVTSFSSMGIVVGRAEEVSGGSSGSAAVSNVLANGVQGGTILHCFDWKYTDIIDELPNIAKAGFTAVQTSPAQPGGGVDSNIWYYLYQPLSFHAETNDLGTKEELRQLCNEAENYGIKIIVDIVSNHLAGDHTYITSDFKDSKYWRTSSGYSGRQGDIYNNLGMPDIKSEDSEVIDAVKSYIQELKEIGVDGVRWDTAKHIQLPSDDDCRFWPEVTSVEGMEHYGEILGLPNDSSTRTGEQIMQEYVTYMRVTDDTYGKRLRDSFNNGQAPSSTGCLADKDNISATDLVYWGESHDTWSNNKDHGYTNEMPQNVIDKAYAIAAARSGAAVLYFSRPDYRYKENIKAGVKGSTHFTSPEVAAVNHFRNVMTGNDYYCTKSDSSAAAVCRPNGAVVVKASGGNGTISITNGGNTTAAGTYIDEVTGNEWTVTQGENGRIHGTIGEAGIAVLYNKNAYPNVTKITSSPVQSGSQTTTLYFDNSQYKWNSVYAYVYDGMGTAKNADWPGQAMTPDSLTGLYKLEGVNNYNGNARVIFVENGNSDNKNRYPAQNTPGMDCPDSAMILNKVKIKKNNEYVWISVWDKYAASTESSSDSVSATASENTFTDTLDVTLNAQGVTNPIYMTSEMTSDSGYGSFTDGQTITIGENTAVGNIYVAVKGLRSDGTMASQVQTFTKQKEGGLLFFKTNGNWIGSRYALYVWNGSDDPQWVDLTLLSDGSTYSAKLPDNVDWKNVIFCQMKSDTTENNWNSKSKQTVDITIPTDGNNLYTLTGTDSTETSKYTGTWSKVDVPDMIVCDNFTGETNDGGGIAFQKQYSELIEYVYNRIKEHQNTIDISDYNIKYTPISKFSSTLTKLLLKTHPDLFFVSRLSMSRTSTDGTTWYYSSITPYYTMDKTEADTKLSEFYDKAEWYLSKLNGNMDDFTKALVLHDLLVLNNYYDSNYKSNYTFMVNGYGVCQNYTEVYAYLLAQEGIKSEIVISDSMNHEWLMVCLDGKYYHVDVTWDDPLVRNVDRPNKVKHSYFLPSDAQFRNEAYADVHSGYSVYYDPDDKYEEYNNLHNNSNPIFYVNGALYTLYLKNNNGVIAVYNPADDTYTDKYTIEDKWLYKIEGNYTYTWTGNYSSIAEYKGIIYYNVEHDIYSYNPITQETKSCYNYSSGQLYGMYIKDEKIYGLVAANPNTQPESVYLVDCESVAPTDTYTVTWKNYDGTVLETDTNVVSGKMPSYDSAEPTKPADAQYTYTFAGWTPTVSAVTGDVTYTATYTSSLREYTITWKMDDGTVIDTTAVAYGETPTHAAPAKSLSGTAQYRYYYEFTGWDRDLTPVDRDAEYTARFEQREMVYYLVGTINNWAQSDDYAFVFNYDDSNVIEYELLNVSLSKNDQLKAKSNKDKWFPSGGDGENYIVPADGTYNIYLRPNASGSNDWHRSVLYFENVTQYTVTFTDGDNSVAEQTVTYGNKVTKPDDPTKYGYTFSGWYIGDTDDEFDFDTPVTDNITLTAHWTVNTVDVQFYDINGIITDTQKLPVVDYNLQNNFTVPNQPYLDGYDIGGWTVDGTECKDEAAVKAAVANLLTPERTEPIAVRVVYNQKEQTYMLNVSAGFIKGTNATNGQYKASDQMYVVAQDGSSDQIFDCWKATYEGSTEEIIVGYEKTYAFRMPSKHITLTANYVSKEEDLSPRKGTAFIESVTKIDNNKLSFVSVSTVPEDACIVKTGVIAQRQDVLDGAVLTWDNAQFKRINETTCKKYHSFKYTWTKSNVVSETWCVRSYLVYTQNNIEYTLLGDTVTASLNDVT